MANSLYIAETMVEDFKNKKGAELNTFLKHCYYFKEDDRIYLVPDKKRTHGRREYTHFVGNGIEKTVQNIEKNSKIINTHK